MVPKSDFMPNFSNLNPSYSENLPSLAKPKYNLSSPPELSEQFDKLQSERLSSDQKPKHVKIVVQETSDKSSSSVV